MTNEDYTFELKLLQLKDTENALENGFKTKNDWFNFIKEQKHDEIAEAIISLSQRESLDVGLVASHFDPTMMFRVANILSKRKTTTVKKAA